MVLRKQERHVGNKMLMVNRWSPGEEMKLKTDRRTMGRTSSLAIEILYEPKVLYFKQPVNRLRTSNPCVRNWGSTALE